MDRRPVALEHRFTTRRRGLIVRYWVEADPAHGGFEHWLEAREAVNQVEQIAPWGDTIRVIALFFINHCRGINSIEVCDDHGDGYAAHKDWP